MYDILLFVNVYFVIISILRTCSYISQLVLWICKDKTEKRKMTSFISNTTIIQVKPFEEHGWVKWCALAMYLETLACCWILGSIIWKEMSKKMTAISFRPLTQQLMVFSIVMVRTFHCHGVVLLKNLKCRTGKQKNPLHN